VQLMKRVQMVPEYTLIGGILRFETMANIVREQLREKVNVPPDNMAQFVGALGAALLAQRRLQKLNVPEDCRRASKETRTQDSQPMSRP